MVFKVKFGEAFPSLGNFLREINVGEIFEDPVVVVPGKIDVNIDGLIHKISHEGGVERLVSDRDGVRVYNPKLRPDSTNKLKVLIEVLTDKFSLTQENGDFILYGERLKSTYRDHPYYAVVLPDIFSVIIVCDQYGEGTRIKKFDSSVTVHDIRNEIAENFRKGDLDNAGFQMVPVYDGSYKSREILGQYFFDLIKFNFFEVDTLVESRANRVKSILKSNTINSPGLKSVVEDEVDLRTNLVKSLRVVFGDDDGMLDVSLISGSFIKKLATDPRVGIGLMKIAKFINVDLPNGVGVQSISALLYVLKEVYRDCNFSLSRLYYKALEYKIDDLFLDLQFLDEKQNPNFELVDNLRDFFIGNDGFLDVSKISKRNIRSLSSCKLITLGPMSIVTILGFDVPVGVDVDSVSGFLYVLKEVYRGCNVSLSRLYYKALQLKVEGLFSDLQFLDESQNPNLKLIKNLKSFFDGNDRKLDVSYISKNSYLSFPSDKSIKLGLTTIVAQLGVDLPKGVNPKSVTALLYVLKEVYRGCSVSLSRLHYRALELKVSNLLSDLRMEIDESQNPNLELIENLKSFFDGDDFKIDVSKINSNVIASLKGQIGFGSKAIVSLTGVSLIGGVYSETPAGFIPVLNLVYSNCPESLLRLNRKATQLGIQNMLQGD